MQYLPGRGLKNRAAIGYFRAGISRGVARQETDKRRNVTCSTKSVHPLHTHARSDNPQHRAITPLPFYNSAGVALFKADSLKILPQFPAESIDLVVTDPPYGIRYQSKRTDGRHPNQILGDDSLNTLRASLPLMDRLLRPDRHAYIFAAPLKLSEAFDAVAEYWQVKNVLVWDKGNAGSRGDCEAGYSQNWEAIIYASKGRRPLVRPRPRCIIRHDWQASRDPVHPTVKPVAIMQWLISKSTAPGERVLDPFMGSGVVPAAAAQLGRQVIGIEIEEQYCKTAAARVAG
jgi:site-specific DNA-methyltransferase (adenine-specific)